MKFKKFEHKKEQHGQKIEKRRRQVNLERSKRKLERAKRKLERAKGEKCRPKRKKCRPKEKIFLEKSKRCRRIAQQSRHTSKPFGLDRERAPLESQTVRPDALQRASFILIFKLNT